MAEKKTTRNLIDELIDVEEELDYQESFEYDSEMDIRREAAEKIKRLKEKKDLISHQIMQKADNIDKFMFNIEKRIGIYDGEIAVYMSELDTLRTGRRRIQKVKDYLGKTLLPLIIKTVGRNGIYETETAKYTLYETWGGLVISDENKIPEQYKQLVTQIDKRILRKAIIGGTVEADGAIVERVEAVRRS